jgi:hypothetical protein
MDEKEDKNWLKILLPRIIKAILWAAIMGIILFFINSMIETSGTFDYISLEKTDFITFSILFIGFEVIIQLFKGTIFQYVTSITRTLVYMIIIVLTTNGGNISFNLQSLPDMPLTSELGMQISFNLSKILNIYLILSLLNIVKNLIQAVELLANKAEEPIVPPELP